MFCRLKSKDIFIFLGAWRGSEEREGERMKKKNWNASIIIYWSFANKELILRSFYLDEFTRVLMLFVFRVFDFKSIFKRPVAYCYFKYFVEIPIMKLSDEWIAAWKAEQMPFLFRKDRRTLTILKTSVNSRWGHSQIFKKLAFETDLLVGIFSRFQQIFLLIQL